MWLGRFPIQRKEIAGFADRSDDINFLRPTLGLAHARVFDRHNLVKAMIKRRANQVVHARVDDYKFLGRGFLDVTNPRKQDAGVADKKATGFNQDAKTKLAHSRTDRL